MLNPNCSETIMKLPGIPREQIIEELEKIGIIITNNGELADKDNINIPDYKYKSAIKLEKGYEGEWSEKDEYYLEAFQDSQHQMYPTMEKIENAFKENIFGKNLEWGVRTGSYDDWKNTTPREKIDNYQDEDIQSKRDRLFKEYEKEASDIDYLAEKVNNNPQLIPYADFRIRYFAYKDIQKVLLLLEKENLSLRQLVIKALGFSNNKQVIGSILPFIADSNKEIRDEALISLGRLGYNDVLPRLINLFNEFKITTFKTANYAYSISLQNTPLSKYRNVAKSIALIGNEDAFEFLCSQIPEQVRFIIDLPMIIAEMKQIYDLNKVAQKFLDIDSNQTVYTKNYIIQAYSILDRRNYNIKELLIDYYSKLDYDEKIDTLFTSIFLTLQPNHTEIKPIKKKLEYLRKKSSVRDTKHYSNLIISRSGY